MATADTPQEIIDRINRLRDGGMTIEKIAKEVGVTYAVAQRVLYARPYGQAGRGRKWADGSTDDDVQANLAAAEWTRRQAVVVLRGSSMADLG